MPELDSYVQDVVRPEVERVFHTPSAQTKAATEAAREEATASTVQAAAVRSLVADGEVVRLTQPAAMIATENNLRRLLTAVWDTLGDDIQKMLITAEYFGDQVPASFDHSGPVLGLFAACERLTRDRLFVPSDAALGGEYRRVTFGEAAETLRRLPHWRSGKVKTLRGWASRRPGAEIDALGQCGRRCCPSTSGVSLLLIQSSLTRRRGTRPTSSCSIDRGASWFSSARHCRTSKEESPAMHGLASSPHLQGLPAGSREALSSSLATVRRRSSRTK